MCEGRNTCAAIQSNVVRGSDGYGVWVRFGACPTVKENEIVSGKADGLGVWHPRSDPIIASNAILRNHGNGITIAKRANPLVKDNTVADNGYVLQQILFDYVAI